MKLVGYTRDEAGILQARVIGEGGEVRTVAPSALVPKLPVPTPVQTEALAVQERVLELHEKYNALMVQHVERGAQEFCKRLIELAELYSQVTKTQTVFQETIQSLSAEATRAAAELVSTASETYREGGLRAVSVLQEGVATIVNSLAVKVSAVSEASNAVVQRAESEIRAQTDHVVETLQALREALVAPKEIESIPVRDSQGRIQKLVSTVRVLA